MNNSYAINIKNITDTSADIEVYSATFPSTTSLSYVKLEWFKASSPEFGSSTVFYDPGTSSGQLVHTEHITGLSPKTEYGVDLNYSGYTTSPVVFTTKIDRNTPRAATQEQWEALATRIKNSEGPTVVQTAGSSTTDVMSQDATTKMLYPSYSSKQEKIMRAGGAYAPVGENTIALGYRAQAANSSGVSRNVAIGYYANTANNSNSVALGDSSTATGGGSMALGSNAKALGAANGVALGAYSSATQKGQMDISTLATTNTYGYNDSQYRLLTGLYDPQNAHDAATKGYVDGLVGDIEAALNVINNGTGA